MYSEKSIKVIGEKLVIKLSIRSFVSSKCRKFNRYLPLQKMKAKK